MTTHERHERLIQALATYGKLSTAQLANILNVSKRTILRDIDKLSLYYPIGSDIGRTGGYYIINYKALNLPCLKKFEVELLEKITSEVDRSSVCSLTPDENQVLKDMIAVYSKTAHEKRQALEHDVENI
jgi:transcriptional antiterminator